MVEGRTNQSLSHSSVIARLQKYYSRDPARLLSSLTGVWNVRPVAPSTFIALNLFH